MPARRQSLTVADVHRHVRERCFAPTPSTRSGRLVGVELEWLPATRPTPGIPDPHPEHGAVRAAIAAAGPLPGGSSITFEPGGQVELSSLPRHGPGAACDVTATDLEALRAALDACEVTLVGVGRDPVRPCRRVLDEPRYTAMEAYFDRDHPDTGATPGRVMMCSTASVQVNLDNGGEGEVARRWRLAHTLGPTLAAVFANSPLAGGRPSSWRSARLANWWHLDPSRTAPPPATAPSGRYAETYAGYALDAQVMLMRTGTGQFVPQRQRLSLGQWVTGGHELGWPTVEDLDYHLTTLFPPVRPRGWLELRVLDALPDPWWRVAVAVTAALMDGDSVAAEAAATPAAGLWAEAARDGLAHPVLAASARSCFEVALATLAGSPDHQAVEEFAARFVARDRCPADDTLQVWADRPELLALDGVVGTPAPGRPRVPPRPSEAEPRGAVRHPTAGSRHGSGVPDQDVARRPPAPVGSSARRG